MKDLDAKFEQYIKFVRPPASARSWPRKSSAKFSKTTISCRCSATPAVNAIGPRIKAEKWQDVFPTITTGYAYPWEDIELKA